MSPPFSSARFHRTQSVYAEENSSAKEFVNDDLVAIQNEADFIGLVAGEKLPRDSSTGPSTLLSVNRVMCLNDQGLRT
ncbi:hypothetical protein K7X08_035307 [Anisodus acutangulus]|uniref:Uncharacterized protein n=1 Tax=Anisodus acutangulus TaxID=402998 RepID=A0A9Q1LKG6_9SOLA|nr:hypothetical protein K7X08_035307 [Anisodus acutangulus]